MTVFVLGLALAGMTTAAVAGTTYHVATNGIDDASRDGLSWEEAFASISYAVVQASHGDTVLVSNGIYQTKGPPYPHGQAGMDIFLNKSLTIKGIGGAENVVLDGNGQEVRAISGWGEMTSYIKGITITNYGNSAISVGAINRVFILDSMVLAGNTAVQGGGVFVNSDSVSVFATNCVFRDNTGTLWSNSGGAVAHINGQAEFVDCMFEANTAAGHGGAIYSAASGLIIKNSLFIGNSAGRPGGAASLNSASEVVNCTIMNNEASGSQGGIVRGHVVNSIIYNNTAPSAPNYGSLSSITHSITDPLPDGEGNIAVDPMLDAEFRPLKGSPAINAGLYQEWMDDATDRAGNPRILMGAVDIGAYEYVPAATLIMVR